MRRLRVEFELNDGSSGFFQSDLRRRFQEISCIMFRGSSGLFLELLMVEVQLSRVLEII